MDGGVLQPGPYEFGERGEVDGGNDDAHMQPRLNLEELLGGTEFEGASRRRTRGAAVLDSDGNFRSDEELVLNDDVEKLYRALWNEQYAPEMLPFKAKLVDDMREIMEYQQGLLDKESEELGASQTEENVLARHLKKIEMERLSYTLRSYYRLRLRKIELNPQFMTKDAESFLRLSAAEQSFAASFSELFEDHLTDSFLRLLPEKLRSKEDRDDKVRMVSGPNLSRFVFCHVETPPGGDFALKPGAPPVRLAKNDILCLPYADAKPLVESDAVVLI